MLGAGGAHPALVQVGVVLALIHHERLAREPHRLLDQPREKLETPIWRVRPCRLASLSAPKVSPSGMSALGQWIRRRSTCREPETPQARLGRAAEIGGPEVAVPDLGGDENLVTRQAGALHARADRLLVAVHRGRVDMPIARLDRPLHRLGASLVPQGPGAEPEGGNSGSVGMDERGLRHGEDLSVGLDAGAATRMTGSDGR